MTNRLLSVNVGLPRDIPWQGKTVHTAVWKQSVEGRRMVRRLNVDGDGQGDLAGHGGEHRAVFVYQTESYEFWQNKLRLTGLAFGAFGENFTVAGLPDAEVCIGDRYRIGGALFEVTQPRVTCYRVGIRLNEPRMPALLVEHGRPGFYLRVLEEGEVGAGDEIVQVAQGPERISVAEMDGLLYKAGHSVERMESALRISALSAGWRSSFKSLLDRPAHTRAAGGNTGLTAAAGPAPAWAGFRTFHVAAKTRETESVTSLMLEPADGRAPPPPLPGQFISLRLRSAASPPPLLRSYSLSSGPGDRRYRISVKRNPGGEAGAYIQENVRLGDVMEVSAPRGGFTLQPGEEPVILLSAGIGVTPLLAMLHALADAGSAREVWWIHGARDRSEQPFVAEVQACLGSLAHAHRHIRYSAPAPGDRLGVDFDAPGRISAFALEALASVPRQADFYVCGPPAFISELTVGLTSWGVAPNRIHSEPFGAGPAFTPGIAAAPSRPPHAPEGAGGDGPMVSFARSGLNVRWVAGYQTLLDLAEACDVPVRWSCRSGVCHSCETAIIAGNVAYAPEPVEPPAAGNLLLCCSRPSNDIVIDL